MVASIHVLHPQPDPIAGFLRVGHTGHRKLEGLHASGRLPCRRFVFDAAHLEEQHDLLRLLKGSECEIVLDSNFAEMAMLGRFGSAIAKLPWANQERPWEPSDFERGRNLDPAKGIAEFAVKHGVSVVLAPAHFIESSECNWKKVDRRMCEALRLELDKAGGGEIEIDYQLITTSALLKDDQKRKDLIEGIDALPIDNVWLRTSGFGANATGVGTRHFIEAVRGLHQIDRPLIADGVGGFPALAAAAFGAIGGISHGVGQKESFNANRWKRPATSGGGSQVRVYVHELDRYFTASQLNAIFDAKGGRPRFGCNDQSCCRHGTEDMIENSHGHFIRQRSRQLDDLSSVPETRRAEHFLLRHLDPAVRSARLGARLRVSDERVATAISNAKKRLVRLRDALADLQAQNGVVSCSRSPRSRGKTHQIRAMGRF
jgi:hypothetical protein